MHYQLRINKLDGWVIGTEAGGEGWTFNHMTAARSAAVLAAVDRALPIAIERVVEASTRTNEHDEIVNIPASAKTVLVINEDGTPQPPAGAKQPGPVANCKAGPGRPPCFCANCRAARR